MLTTALILANVAMLVIVIGLFVAALAGRGDRRVE